MQVILPDNQKPDPVGQSLMPSAMTPSAGTAFKGIFDFDYWNYNFTQMGFRSFDLYQRGSEGDKVSPEDLAKEYDPKIVRFTEPHTRSQADAIYRHKQEEIERNMLWDRSGSIFSASGFAAVTGSLAGSMADPLALGLGFAIQPTRLLASRMGASALMSKFGQADATALLGTTVGRDLAFSMGVQRLGGPWAAAASNDLLKRVGGNFVLSTVDNVIANAALEPGMYAMQSQFYSDYTALDSLLNVTVGGVFGGAVGGAAVLGGAGLHAVGRQMPSWLGGMKQQTHDFAFAKAIADLTDGNIPKLQEIITAGDPNRVKAGLAIDESIQRTAEDLAKKAKADQAIKDAVAAVEQSKNEKVEVRVQQAAMAKSLMVDSPVSFYIGVDSGKLHFVDNYGNHHKVDLPLSEIWPKGHFDSGKNAAVVKKLIDHDPSMNKDWQKLVPSGEVKYLHVGLVDRHGRILLSNQSPASFAARVAPDEVKSPAVQIVEHLEKQGIQVKEFLGSKYQDVFSDQSNATLGYAYFEVDLENSKLLGNGWNMMPMYEYSNFSVNQQDAGDSYGWIG
jgi:hypothetical protein